MSAISYISDAAVVVGSKLIREHLSPDIRSLAGKTVKVFPETAHDVFFKGKKIGKAVKVIPLGVPGDVEPRRILAEHLRSSDPAILDLKA